jgi:REP element-mobilizing transposase RayT
MVRSIAWVVMPDHLHWLLVLQKGNIAAVIRLLKGRSARKLKPLCSFTRVWQPAYYDQALRDNQDLKIFARYIVTNPLRAGLVKRMGDYSHWDAEWL